MATLDVHVELYEPRYHGWPEWPPSPGRLFQALVAGAARGGTLPEPARAALSWLEQQPPPRILAPSARPGQTVCQFVPNNDLDGKAAKGDPGMVEKVRTPKKHRPWLIEGPPRIVYRWEVSEDRRADAEQVCRLAEDLVQLGRGVDMAFARGEVHQTAPETPDEGGWMTPSPGGDGGQTLPCPVVGTLRSLERRKASGRRRLLPEKVDGKARLVYEQRTPVVLRSWSYNAPVQRTLFEIQSTKTRSPATQSTRYPGRLKSVPLAEATAFTIALRDNTRAALVKALPTLADAIDTYLVGKPTADGVRPRSEHRIRLIPLPSIGHDHTDPSIRRVLVEIPAACPLRADDLLWACERAELPGDRVLVRSTDRQMLRHYGLKGASRTWSSVTPMALPAARRRLDPARTADEHKDAGERQREESSAVRALGQALRHAGVEARLVQARVSREPVRRRIVRAECFAADRFAKERLWHVELTLDRAVEGPLVLGDGRFLGLGVLAPVRATAGAYTVRVVDGWNGDLDPVALCRAFRRAVLARCQHRAGSGRSLPTRISGHETDGRPAQTDDHLYYACDRDDRTLTVFGPRLVRSANDGLTTWERQVLEQAFDGFVELRAGRQGLLRLAPGEAFDHQVHSQVWRSDTPYLLERHHRSTSAHDAAEQDVLAAVERAGLPRPGVRVERTWGESGKGVKAHLTLTFATAVSGPLLLGRDRHHGGGRFVPAD